MSVLVPSLTNNHHHHHSSSSYYSTNTNYRINGNLSQTKSSRLTQNKINDNNNTNNNDQTNDHVPHGVVNSMKQRLLDKVNESLLLNNRQSSRLSSNENLFQIKPILKSPTRLSRSQENLLNNHPSESLTSYLQPKQDVIIVDTTIITNDETHRQSYIELHVDEVPKPGIFKKNKTSLI